MGARLLITTAGSGASNNLMRSLCAASPSVFLVGCHDDQFILKNSLAERNYLVPPAGHPQWILALCHIVESERINLILPTTDADVSTLSRARSRLSGRLFLPGPMALETCEDKYRLITLLRAGGVSAPVTYCVTRLDHVGRIFRRLGDPPRAWCRIRTGAGATGAISVRGPEQARGWIAYWREMRGVRPTSFVLSEYLPGRDFGCQSLWKNGRMVLIKTYERLSYLGTGSQPVQASSVAALAKTVCEPRVVETCVKAIRLLDAKASGVFSADLKDDISGVPCITEINAGRFSSATNIFDLVGKHNMAATYVRLALGAPITLREEYDVAEDWYMLRDIDNVPRMFDAEEFFDGIEDVRELGQRRAGQNTHPRNEGRERRRSRPVGRH